MKIRLISKKKFKKAYEREEVKRKIDVREELGVENIEKVPEEVFEILGRTLSYVEKLNNLEGKDNEDK